MLTILANIDYHNVYYLYHYIIVLVSMRGIHRFLDLPAEASRYYIYIYIYLFIYLFHVFMYLFIYVFIYLFVYYIDHVTLCYDILY